LLRRVCECEKAQPVDVAKMVRCSVACLLGVMLLFGASRSSAEESATSQVDGLYASAVKAADSGDRTAARRLAVEVLVLSPEYSDATVLLARLDGWEGRHAPARDALNRVIERSPDHLAARRALIDIEYWAGEHERAAELCAENRRRYPADDELRSRCATVSRAGLVAQASKQVVGRPRTSNPKVKRDESASATYRTSLDYSSSIFDNDLDSWHAVHVASERRDDRIALIARAGYLNRFNESILELEAEAYPSLGENTYAHLKMGLATGDIVHDFKLGGEIVQGLMEQIEGSLGVWWTAYDDHVVTLSGSLGRYWKRWFFQGLFAVDTSEGDAVGSGALKVRFSFPDAEESLTGTVGFGERYEQEEALPVGAGPGVPETVRLLEIDTTSFGVDWRKRISERYIGKLSFATKFQEIEGDDRVQVVLGVGFEHLF